MEQQYQTQLNTAAQSIVALFAANNSHAIGTNTPVPNDLVSILSVDPSFKDNVSQAFQKAATNQKPLTNVDTKVLVSTAVSNIITLLKSKYSAEQIQGMELKITNALAAGRPSKMEANEYNALIKKGLTASSTVGVDSRNTQSFGQDAHRQETKPSNPSFKK
jgi:hypothetical protein